MSSSESSSTLSNSWEHSQYNLLCFLGLVQSRSLYIDMMIMILPLKCSDSHFDSVIFFFGGQGLHGEARKVSQLSQHGHVRDVEGRSAGFLLTPNISPCPKKKRKRQASRSAQSLNQNTFHVGAAVSYCAVRLLTSLTKPVSTSSAP